MPPKKPHPDKPIGFREARDKIAKAMQDLLGGNDPGTVSFSLKPSKKANHLYLLKLTQHQRQTLLDHVQMDGKLRQKISDAGDGTQVVGVTRRELDQLNDGVGSASVDARSPHKKRLVAVQRRVSELFSSDYRGLVEAAARQAQAAPTMLYQFKITLLDVQPAIWRRIQVEDCTLSKLHESIQAAMGWLNCHLHLFVIDGDRYGLPSPDGDDFGMKLKDESKVLLSQVIPKSGKPCRWRYAYDFGDGWEHEILFEGSPTVDPKLKYPLCVEGERACPPEDCGGPFGYVNFLEAIEDPEHEEHEMMVEWIGGGFYPETFSAKVATKAMRDGLPETD
jgi:hypothetical protein